MVVSVTQVHAKGTILNVIVLFSPDDFMLTISFRSPLSSLFLSFSFSLSLSLYHNNITTPRQRLYKENAIMRKEGALSEDNWEEELEQIPLFMTKAPTAEQVAANPQLQMIQQIVEEESNPESRALYSKDHGNAIFMKAKKMPKSTHMKVRNSEYHKAMKLYDEGLEEKCDNQKLNAILYSNRAAINLLLGNSRKVINDCTEAVKLDKSNIKAYFRAATACSKLENYGEAIEWADNGLFIDPANKTLMDARTKANKAKGAIDKEARKKAMQKKKEEKAAKELSTAIAARGIQLTKGVETEMKQRTTRGGGVVEVGGGGNVYLDSDGMLHWPLLILYPEHKQTDFIQDFNEGSRFQDHLENMFAERT